MKIFGVGLGKTGTTSLHFALETLGFRSAHSASHVSETINREAAAGRPLLSTLEGDYDAFLDWPISCLFPQLDRRFPSARFILTLRDPIARYRSALRHAEEDRRRRDQSLSYAMTEVEPEASFILDDARHREWVQSYFASRPSDLLCMRLTEGDGWDTLCPFLGVDVPAHPFPHHHAVGSHQSHFLRLAPSEPKPIAVNLKHWAASQ